MSRLKTKSVPFLLLMLASSVIPAAGGNPDCGGTFTAARGVLQTPGFPGPFPVPINCKWIIDASNLAGPNTSIVVYLTQLFVFGGLTFTDYVVYDGSYTIIGKVLHTVNETNIVQAHWVQTNLNYLVIELKLESIESEHLRVLDNFLDVYGFNVTYEITNGPIRPNSCTMKTCGFTGICYDHFNKFTCDCFEGYSGPQCSNGPKSLCYSNGIPVCKNNATCTHCGTPAIICHCKKGFIGRKCEIPTPTTSRKDCDNCQTRCPNEKLDNVKSNQLDFIGYGVTMHMSKLPNFNEQKLKNYIRNQIVRALKSNFTKVENVSIDSVNHFNSGVDVAFHFYWLKKEEKKVKSVLNQWIENRSFGNVTVLDKELQLKTVLSIQSFTVNQQGILRIGDEFILSCVARGSSRMVFRWFKDGLLINVTAESNKWTRLIKDPHVQDQYTALLAVQSAKFLDDGVFTCQVEDFNIQQCLSKRIQIGRPPNVNIEPMSVTVKKGGNFTLKCISQDEPRRTFNYIWTKNKTLLPVRTSTERYEILYPSGTILQVFNAERDVEYSCTIQDGTLSSKKEVKVYVVDNLNVHTCAKEKYLSLDWPETAPDTKFFQLCPEGYTGTVVRACMLRDGQKPSWATPDFSSCLHNELVKLPKQMELLKLGYLHIDPKLLMDKTLQYLDNDIKSLLPGQGAEIINIIQDMLQFISKTGISHENMTLTFTQVIDKILLHKRSLLNETHVQMVPEVIVNYLNVFKLMLIGNESSILSNYRTFGLILLNLSRINENHFYIPPLGVSYEELKGITVDGKFNSDHKGNNILIMTLYKNLSLFLPPRSYLRIKDGSEIEYEIVSEIVTFQINDSNTKVESLRINFPHKFDKTDRSDNYSNVDIWSIKCASADFRSFVDTWDIYRCQTLTLEDLTIQCDCPFAHTFALLLTTTSIKTKSNIEDDPRRYVLIGGCALCMALALFTSACLATSCWIQRATCLIFLKLQCSISIFCTALLFTWATVRSPDKILYIYFITALETFMLLALSSHLSKLLIVFTELVHLPRPVTSKETVIGIISGVPFITVFGSHIAYRTMNIKLQSWWMIVNSFSFNLYVTVVAIFTMLFIFVYAIVMNKLQHLVKQHVKHSKSIKKRIALLRRSACLFTAISVLSISSILYINFPDKVWSLYQFGSANVILGLVLIFCYVLKGETEFHNLFSSKSKLNKDDKFFSVDSASSPLNFLAKQEAEVENESGMYIKPDIHPGNSTRGPECHNMMDNICKPQGISATFESCLQNSTSFCDGESQIRTTEKLECYNSSPQQFRKFANNHSHSPDILSSKNCVELDLVASVQNKIHTSDSPTLHRRKPTFSKAPEEAISQILETDLHKEPRTQPDGHENKIINVSDVDQIPPPPPPPSADKLDGMLDRICHDLDFLLNRSGDVELEENVISTSSLRRISKPPSLSVIHQIKEEEELDTVGLDLQEPITDIMRTEC